MIFYACLSFTSKRVVEVEVLADIELLLDQQLETKRVAAGYFCFLSLNNEHRIVPVAQIKVRRSQSAFLDRRTTMQLTNLILFTLRPETLSSPSTFPFGVFFKPKYLMVKNNKPSILPFLVLEFITLLFPWM